MFDNIEVLKAKLEAMRPLPQHTIKSLRENLILEWTYNSNAIEGNTLTLNETKVVLEGVTVGGKTIREHFEAINHREAIYWVESLVAHKEVLSTYLIKQIHQIVLKNIDDNNAGKFRNENVVISGASHTPPDFTRLSELMDLLVVEYEASSFHPIERACRLHTDFVKIHPFVDGNGRTARLLLNLSLIQNGWLPIVIKATDRAKYYDVLDLACVSADYSQFVEMVVVLQEEALKKHLSICVN